MPFRAVCAVCVLLLAACDGESDATQAAFSSDTVRPVKIAMARDALQETMKVFPGVTEASRKSELAFRVGGQVIELPIREGKQMAKGDLVARLDDIPYRTILSDRQAKYELAKIDYDRQNVLFSKKHVAQARLDEARSNFRVAQAALKQARDDLSYTRLTAPYDGMISRVDIDTYQNVLANAPIAQFQGNENIDITFNVPESLFLSLNKDNTNNGYVQIRFDAMPDRVFDAWYREHETLPDTATRSYEVTVSMPRPTDLTVLPGMSVAVHVDLSEALRPEGATGVLVPSVSVFEAEGKTWVWRLDEENRARRIEVEAKGIDEALIRVADGLADGDRVVAAGTAYLREGQAVRPLVKERGL